MECLISESHHNIDLPNKRTCCLSLIPSNGLGLWFPDVETKGARPFRFQDNEDETISIDWQEQWKLLQRFKTAAN